MTVPISKITGYFDDKSDDSIAESIHFNFECMDSVLDLAIHKINDQGTTKIIATSEKKNKKN